MEVGTKIQLVESVHCISVNALWVTFKVMSENKEMLKLKGGKCQFLILDTEKNGVSILITKLTEAVKEEADRSH